MSYVVGDRVSVAGEFRNATTLAAVDPDAVLLDVRQPGGKVLTYTYGVGSTIVKDSTGNYHAEISLHLAGTWFYRWYSTGSGQAAREGQLTVDQPMAIRTP